jgi:hypothetical protein
VNGSASCTSFCWGNNNLACLHDCHGNGNTGCLTNCAQAAMLGAYIVYGPAQQAWWRAR